MEFFLAVVDGLEGPVAALAASLQEVHSLIGKALWELLKQSDLTNALAEDHQAQQSHSSGAAKHHANSKAVAPGDVRCYRLLPAYFPRLSCCLSILPAVRSLP